MGQLVHTLLSDLLTQLWRHSHCMPAICSIRMWWHTMAVVRQHLALSFDSTQSIETATVNWDDAQQPVQVYSVVTVYQCNHRFVVVAMLVFVCHSHCSVIVIDLAYVNGMMHCAHQLHGSLSRRNSFQLYETALNKRGRKERKKKTNSITLLKTSRTGSTTTLTFICIRQQQLYNINNGMERHAFSVFLRVDFSGM